MSKIVADVKRAIVKTCMANGIEDLIDILTYSAQAINSMGEMTVPAYKAWITMDKQNTAKLIKNRKRINSRRVK